MQAMEIELKFPVDDVESFRSKVAALEFWLKTERTFEANTLYDTPLRDLRAKKQILRLRTYAGKCTLTHKRKHDNTDGRYKTRVETETFIEDPEAMAEIFAQLGYVPAFRYEKFRTEWDSEGGGHLVLDETPIGVWAELEGPPEWIDAMTQQLGIAPAICSTDSYGTMFLQWRERTGASAEHMTFAAIEAAAVTA